MRSDQTPDLSKSCGKIIGILLVIIIAAFILLLLFAEAINPVFH